MKSRCKYCTTESNSARANAINRWGGAWLSKCRSMSSAWSPEIVCIPATIVEPTSMHIYPAAVNIFFENPTLWPPKSLYQMLRTSKQTLEAKASLPYLAENIKQTGTSSQRRSVAFWVVIRPAGRGRSGLFFLSSSGS